MDLSIRSWNCPICNTIHDRDINASINILNQGLNFLSGLGTKSDCNSQELRKQKRAEASRRILEQSKKDIESMKLEATKLLASGSSLTIILNKLKFSLAPPANSVKMVGQ